MATLILTPSVWEERLTTRFCIDLNLHDCFVAVESRDALERWQVSWPQPLRFSPATNTPIRRRRFIPWVPLDFICDTEPGDGWHTDDIRQPTIFKAVQKARLITIAGISSRLDCRHLFSSRTASSGASAQRQSTSEVAARA